MCFSLVPGKLLEQNTHTHTHSLITTERGEAGAGEGERMAYSLLRAGLGAQRFSEPTGLALVGSWQGRWVLMSDRHWRWFQGRKMQGMVHRTLPEHLSLLRVVQTGRYWVL